MRVVDGDTVDLSLDLGFNIVHKVRVRLYGVNTPELRSTKSASAKEAKQFVESWFSGVSDLRIETFKDDTDKYGRYLANIYDGDKCLNTLLLNNGLATPYFGGSRA